MSGTSYLQNKPGFPDLKEPCHIVTQLKNGTIIAHVAENRQGNTGDMVSIGSDNPKE
jgi:hypothetical protein